MSKKRDAFSPDDSKWMAQAITLARRGIGNVEPNPLVGAIVVKNGKALGKGYHRYFGGPHAEIYAIREALKSVGEKGVKGSTIYVSLEPCCHWGKTPPCTDAILAVGIARVVVAMADPFAKVKGRGIALLRKAGLKVEVGLHEDEAKSLNASFLTRLRKKRPFVITKWAQSLDGAIAMPSGESQWISGETSRAFVQKLRGRVDAIIVGSGTVLADNPLLIARPERGADIKRVATRIVLDTECRLSLDSQLVKTVAFAPTMVVHRDSLIGKAAARRAALAARGVMTLPMPMTEEEDSSGKKNQRLDIRALLTHLADRDYANVMVEGGAHILGSLLRADLIDEAHIFIAPMIIGDQHAPRAIRDLGITTLAAVPRWSFQTINPSGEDVHLIARRKQR